MKKDLSILLWLFIAFTLFFLGIQKPLFLIYNHGFGKLSPSFHDILEIYVHGFAIDMATVGYMMAIPLLLFGIKWVWAKFPIKKSLNIYLVIISILLTLGALADASLYEFWEFKLDRMAFFYLNDPKDAFASVSVGYLLVRLLGWIVLSAISYALLAWPLWKVQLGKIKTNPWLRGVLFVVIGGALFAMIRGLRIWPNTPGRAFYSNVTFYNHAALNPIFNLMYSLQKEEDDYKEFDAFDEKTRAKLYEGLFPTKADSTEKLIKTSRPNVLVVVLEGFGSCFIEGLGGMKDVGVNINRLLPESVVFDSCYCGSFRTDRGIVCAVSGYLGQPTTSIMRFTHKIKHLPGLPKTLKKYGYQTQALYGGDVSFFNMSEYFLDSGHDKLVTEDDFPASDRTTKWGVPDHVTFNWLYNDIVRRDKEKSGPWYTTFLTISSHNPFDVPYHRLKDKKYNAFAYTDQCFGTFIDKLKKTPAWKNLLIVVVADHGFNWRESASPKFPYIPFLMMGGAIKHPQRIHKLISQTDLPATVLGQMGIPHEDFTFSRDVMGNTYRYPFGFNTFNNGFNFCDSTGCTVYDNVSKRAIYGNDKRRINIGKAILQTLYHDMAKR